MQNLLTKFKTSSKVTTTLVVFIFLLINYISYGLYFRQDLSESGALRLTSSTENLLENLPETLTIEAYFSEEVPEAAVQRVKQAKDFLREYAASGGRNVKLVFLDPDTDEEARRRANALQIQPGDMAAYDQNKQEVVRAYFSVALNYGDKSEIIQNALNQGSLEYELTTKVYTMANPVSRKIGFLSGNTPFSVNEQRNGFISLDLLNRSLESFYGTLQSVNIENDDIPGDISTLIVIQPRGLSEIEKFRIDQFLMRGGNLIIAASGMTINFQSLQAMAANADVLNFYKHYGFDIKSDMLFDPRAHLPFPMRVNQFMSTEVPYPVWVFAPGDYMNDDHLISSKLEGLFIPYASSLELTGPLTQDNASQTRGNENSAPSAVVLARTSPSSYSKTGMVMVAPQAMKNMADAGPKETPGQKIVSVYATGIFDSYYAERELPENAPEDYIKKGTNEARILVITSPYSFASVGVQRSQGQNINYLLGALDIMNGFDDLLALRKKNRANPQLATMEHTEKQIFTFLNFLLPLLTIAVVGVVRLLRRRELSKSQLDGNRVNPKTPQKQTENSEVSK